MSLLNSIASAVGGQGGGQAALLPALIEQIKNYPGGLAGLIERFQQGGLGELVSSWVSAGPNQPVSGDQLHAVLGDGMVSELSQQSGLEKGSVLEHLATLLPSLVDQATPDGQASADTDVSSNLLGSLSGLLGRL